MEVLQRTANRGSISTGYDIENSLKVERTNTEYLHRTVSSGGNAKVWCASMWIKRTELDGSQQFWQFLSSMTSNGSGGYSGWPTRIGFWYSTNGLWVDSRHGTGNARLTSLVLQRDTSAWYHIVVMQDTTQSTDTNRTKIYINGTLLLPADLDYDQYPAQNADTAMHVLNSRVAVGAQADGGYPWSGYIADVHLLDGQTGKTPSDFAEYDEDSGIWKPKAYTGAYGTNGFHLKFEDSSNMGLDSSGNGNNLTSNNITAADQATDTPTNNFATLNLQVSGYANTGGATEGGTKIPWSGVNSYGAFYATQAVKAGKWYWEFYVPSRSASYGLMNYIGLHTMEELILGSPYRSEAMKNNVFWLMHYGDWYAHVNGSQSSQNTAAGLSSRGAEAAGRTYAIAFNADDAEITYYENGTRISNLEFDIFDLDERMAAGTFVVPWFQVYHNDLNVNFGGYSSIAISSGNTDANGYGNFEYAPPSGYYALCSKNLAEFG